jgi:C4-dicarboxylate-specific signal transduction histidine kinase
VLTLMQPELRLRQTRVSNRLPADLPAVAGDRVLLEQVVLNLVLNSVQAMQGQPAETRAIEIDGGVTDGGVWLRIADRGPGVAEAVAPRLFEPFFTTRDDGLGLGLNICRTIVESHRGRLSFAPREGGGAVFTVHLPPAPPADPTTP